MVDYNNTISVIRDNGGFKPNKDDSSFYRTYILQGSKPIQVRLSNHGTHLWTWDKNGEYIPSYAINICVVFMSGTEGYSKPNTTVEMAIKDENGNIVGQKKDYEIIEYVYNCDNLSAEDCAMINKEIVLIPINGEFKDPFSEDAVKHCSVYRLHPNANPELIKESKLNKNMKTKKTITESQLRNIVAESVKKVLRESDEFKPNAYRTASNLGGHEVQISDTGDAARFRFYGGEPTDWMEIEFDEDGVAYVDTPRGRELLSNYLRY